MAKSDDRSRLPVGGIMAWLAEIPHALFVAATGALLYLTLGRVLN